MKWKKKLADLKELVIEKIPRDSFIDCESDKFRMFINGNSVRFGMMSFRTLGWTMEIDRADFNVMLEDMKMQMEYSIHSLNSRRRDVSIHIDLLFEDVMFNTVVGRWSIPIENWNVIMRELRSKLTGK